jgi:hypothetical protein
MTVWLQESSVRSSAHVVTVALPRRPALSTLPPLPPPEARQQQACGEAAARQQQACSEETARLKPVSRKPVTRYQRQQQACGEAVARL